MKNTLSFISFFCLLFFTNSGYTQATYEEALFDAIEWRHLGPFRGGRSAAVTGVPGQPNLFYFGATGGGVWKTTNGGRNWENITDGYFGGSIGAVAVSTWDPNVIYVGGGEVTLRGNVSSGSGMWKSVDAGKTWSRIGLKNSRHIPRIRIHPKNPDIVYAAVLGNIYKPTADRGVYRSQDGGATWEKILFVNEMAGAVDLCMDPNNPRILYASTWRARRTPYSLSSGGEGSALWKSTDGGDNWERVSDKKGMPEGTLGIIGVTVSPVNSERVWAIVEAKNGGVFRSDDGGETWSKLNDDRSLRQRAWYYTRIYADPQDIDVVYVMNVRYHKSKDGGKTFKAYNAPHGDHHDLWIAPEDPQRMIIADDGGAQVTYDGGETWSTYYNQPTAQFYRVTTDDHFPYRIYVAQQDNSTLRIYHRTEGSSIGERDWESTAGCECGHIAIDPEDNDIVYGGCYDGLIERKDHRNNLRRNVSVWPDNPMGHGAEDMKYRFQWNFPIFFSPHNPDKLYTASNHLHVSTDEGQSWDLISPDLTRNDPSRLGSSGGPITKDNTSVEYYCTIFAALESPRVEGLLWTGSDDGLIHVSRDGGQNWENVTPPNMPEWMMINSIEADPFNDGGLYVAGTLYKTGDFRPYLYKTKDYGKTWTKMVKGIGEEHFTRVIRADPVKQGILYAGTENGVYVSFNDGAEWQPLQLNLPIVPITDMAVKNNNLIAATQGRSIWMIDDLTPLHQLNPSIAKKQVHLYQPMDTYRMMGSQNKEVKNAGVNHPGGVMVHFYLAEEPDSNETVSLSFHHQNGDLIRTFSTDAKEKKEKLEVKKGANRFVWNTRYPDAKDFEGMVLWWASLAGPRVVPGAYIVKLKAGDLEETTTFSLLKDPRSPSTQEDLQAQFRFVKEVLEEVSEAHKAIVEIRSIREQMNTYTKRLDKENHSPIIEKAAAIDSMMTEVEEALYQTQNRSQQDPLNFPIRLTNKLAHLNSVIGGGDYRPTEQALAVKEELSRHIKDELRRFDELKENELPKLNRMVKEAEIDAIQLEEE
jgi:photosystem II stability/assembly factor-like uncharacterized protein